MEVDWRARYPEADNATEDLIWASCWIACHKVALRVHYTTKGKLVASLAGSVGFG